MEAFPRGGATGGSGGSKVAKRNGDSSSSTYLFDQKERKNDRQRKRKSGAKGKFSFKKQRTSAADLKDSLDDEILSKLKIYHPSMKNLRKGMLLYGVIKMKVLGGFLISGCNDLIGFLPLKQNSGLSVGDFVPCYVKDISSDKRLTLSCEPSDINKAIPFASFPTGGRIFCKVQSEEDHGFIIDTGNDSFKGFLSFSQMKTRNSLSEGNYFFARVTKKSNKNVVSLSTLSAEEEVVDFQTVGSFIPGTEVDVKIISVLKDGVCVSFAGSFIGSIPFTHIHQSFDSNWNTWFTKDNNNFKAKLVAIDPVEKDFSLSISPRLVDPEESEISISKAYLDDSELAQLMKAKGARFDDCRVVKTVPYLGIYVRIEEMSGFISKNRLNESMDIERMKNGQQLACRCIEVNPFDGLLLLSCEQDVLDSAVLSPDEISLGQEIPVTVFKTGNFGVIVKFSLGLKGLVPYHHLSDVAGVIGKDPLRKFTEGKVIKAKVVEIGTDETTGETKFVFTVKKSIMKSKLPIISDMESAEPGTVTHGVVTKVMPDRIFIAFYNNMFGMVNRKDLRSFGVKDPIATFKIGQTLRVRIIAAQGKTLHLSLRTKTISKEVKLGKIYTCEVSGKEDNGLIVNLKVGSSSIEAFLPIEHLTDHKAFAYNLLHLEKYSVGKTIDKAIVVECSGHLVVSIKESMLSTSLREIGEGVVFTGFVSSVEENGAVFGFLSSNSDSIVSRNDIFVHKSFLTDAASEPNEKVSDRFSVGDTALGCVTEISESEVGQIELKVSLKASSLGADPNFKEKIAAAFLNSFFASQASLSATSVEYLDTNKLKIGNPIACKVIRKTTTKVICILDNKVEAKDQILEICCSKANCSSTKSFDSIEVADKVKGTILDINLSSKKLEMKLVENVKANKKRKTKTKTSKQESAPETVGVVVSVMQEYCILQSASSLFIAWLQFDQGLPASAFVKPGMECIFKVIEDLDLPDQWSHLTPVYLTLAGHRALDNAVNKGRKRLFSESKEKETISEGAVVRFKLMTVHENRGVASVMLLNVKRKKKFKKHTFIGIHCTDVISGAQDPESVIKDFTDASVFDVLKEGEVLDGEIVEIEERDSDKLRHVVHIRPEFVEKSLGDIQNSFENGEEVLGIIGRITENGLEVHLNRTTKGVVFWTDLSSDLTLLNKIYSAPTEEEKLETLGLVALQPKKFVCIDMVEEGLFSLRLKQ